MFDRCRGRSVEDDCGLVFCGLLDGAGRLRLGWTFELCRFFSISGRLLKMPWTSVRFGGEVSVGVTYNKALRASVCCQALLSKASQCILALHRIFKNAFLGCRGVRILEDEEHERQDGIVSCIHGKPVGTIEEAFLVHPRSNVDNISSDTDASSGARI